LPLRLTITLCAAALLVAGGIGIVAWPTLVRVRVVAVFPRDACVAAGIPVRYLGVEVGHVERVQRSRDQTAIVTLALTRADLPLTGADRIRETADEAGVEILRASGRGHALDPRRDTLRAASPALVDPRAETALRELQAAGVQISTNCHT
jgi:hypothetical protein